MITLTLTEAEARALQHALANSINDGSDEDVFGGRQREIAAVWRASGKLDAAVKLAREIRGVRARRSAA